PGNQLGLNLTGLGLEIGIWDSGLPLKGHQELIGRVTTRDQASVTDHATHVAGTLAAAGVRSEARGMAYQAHLRAYDWDDDSSEMAIEARRGVLVSNHSYGAIAGWYYGDLENNGDQWYWLGDPNISPDEDYLFGWYDGEASQFDRVVFANPYLLPVVAAGNDRGDRGPRGGTYRALDAQGHWSTFAFADGSHPRDGGADGYDTIAGSSLAKNVLTVGSIRVTNDGTRRVSSFSSFGPTDDGRIKPDLVGYGEGVLSSVADSPTAYALSSGTSMATPNVAGSLTLLQQHYFNLTGKYMRAATLKGLALHTADDLGTPGPDYQYGWGLLDTEAAARLLSTSPENELAVVEATLEDSVPFTRPSKVTDAGPLRVTLSWTDLTSSRRPLNGPSSLDDPTPHLRNDLDLRVINETTGEVYLPYTLDPQAPDQPAVPGDNVVDPIEQIYLPHVEAGDYTIVVSHKDNLVIGAPQVFALIVSGAESAVRPVSVSHVEIEESVERVLLSWKTQFERSPGQFLIQRAPVTTRPGSGERVVGVFALVGTVETAGVSEQVQAYDFEELRVPAGWYRYRVLYEGPNARYLAASIEAFVPAPERFAVLSNYPNPFTDRTQVVLDLPEQQRVTLEVYDVLGRRLLLVHDGLLPAGRHELSVKATGWAPGIYIARLTTPNAAQSHRMVVMR
ncbi:MAG: S8 family serine peptidase, partial [Bacteroidetes bacterium]|nr:S8 family serine peptidase [Bacteroidota bacterium]